MIRLFCVSLTKVLFRSRIIYLGGLNHLPLTTLRLTCKTRMGCKPTTPRSVKNWQTSADTRNVNRDRYQNLKDQDHKKTTILRWPHLWLDSVPVMVPWWRRTLLWLWFLWRGGFVVPMCTAVSICRLVIIIVGQSKQSLLRWRMLSVTCTLFVVTSSRLAAGSLTVVVVMIAISFMMMTLIFLLCTSCVLMIGFLLIFQKLTQLCWLADFLLRWRIYKQKMITLNIIWTSLSSTCREHHRIPRKDIHFILISK